MFSWYKYLIVGLVFSRLGFWSGNLFLIAPFPDLCLLVPFYRILTSDNKAQLSTTSSTTIKSIQAFPDVNEETKDIIGTRQVIGNFQSVKVTRQIACQMSKTDIKETNSKDQIIRCTTCKFKQLKEGLEATISILGSIGEDDEKKSINYQAIKVFRKKTI